MKKSLNEKRPKVNVGLNVDLGSLLPESTRRERNDIVITMAAGTAAVVILACATVLIHVLGYAVWPILVGVLLGMFIGFIYENSKHPQDLMSILWKTTYADFGLGINRRQKAMLPIIIGGFSGGVLAAVVGITIQTILRSAA